MKTYTQEEFIELVNSGDFNIIEESQLEDEGWEYDEISGDYTNPFDEDSIAINDSIFSLFSKRELYKSGSSLIYSSTSNSSLF